MPSNFSLSAIALTSYVVFPIIAGTVIAAFSHHVLINRFGAQDVIEAFSRCQRIPRPDMRGYKLSRRAFWSFVLQGLSLVIITIILLLSPYPVFLMVRSAVALADVDAPITEPLLILTISLLASVSFLGAAGTALPPAIDQKTPGLRSALQPGGAARLLLDMITGSLVAAIITYFLVQVVLPLGAFLVLHLLLALSDVIGFLPLDFVFPVLFVLFAMFFALTSLFCMMMIAATLPRHYVPQTNKK